MNTKETKNIQELLNELEIDFELGVSEKSLQNRREKFGINEIEPKKQAGLFIHFLKELKNPLNAILIIAGMR